MEVDKIRSTLRNFTGTENYWKIFVPGLSPLVITDGCKYVKDVLKSNWLFESILIFQNDKRLKGVNFQLWELRQSKKDLSWLLTCKRDSDQKPLISQKIEFSDFPLDYIKIYVIDKIALLPSEN